MADMIDGGCSAKGPYCFLKSTSTATTPAPGLISGTNPTRSVVLESLSSDFDTQVLTHHCVAAAAAAAAATHRARSEARGVLALLSRGSAGTLQIHLADPSAQLGSATLEFDGRWGGDCTPAAAGQQANTSRLTVVLPTGPNAGSTAVAMCDAAMEID